MKIILALTTLLCFTCIKSISQSDTTDYYSPSKIQDSIFTKTYNPVAAGIISYVFPGLGQYYCDEKQRGYKFMAAFGGSLLIMTSGVLIAVAPQGSYNNLVAGSIVFLGGFTTSIGVVVWSSIDAVKIANTKNALARMSHSSMRLQPALIQHQQNLFTGLTLKLEF